MRHECIATGCGETRMLDVSAATIATVKHHNLLNLNLTRPASPRQFHALVFSLNVIIVFCWMAVVCIFFYTYFSNTKYVFWTFWKCTNCFIQYNTNVHIFYDLLLFKVYFYCVCKPSNMAFEDLCVSKSVLLFFMKIMLTLKVTKLN